MIGLVLDIETTGWYTIDSVTGTLPDANEILEIGFIRVDMNTKEILNHGVLYFYKDYFQVESPAQEVHKLQRSFLEKHADEFQRNLIILNSLIQQSCLIGKNSSGFDLPFIKEFINKHSNGALNIDLSVQRSKIKCLDGSPLIYQSRLFEIDLQNIMCSKDNPFFKKLCEEYAKNPQSKYTCSEMYDTFKSTFQLLYYVATGEMVKGNKKGTLTEYVKLLNLEDKTLQLYNSLDKERTTGAHGALYDVCATYEVWCFCKDNNMY